MGFVWNEVIPLCDYSNKKMIHYFRTIGDLMDFYLTIDTLLLCDVFENFRTYSLEHYGLAPEHFVSGPQLRWLNCWCILNSYVFYWSWNAALFLTKVELEIPEDKSIHNFIDKSIRGIIPLLQIFFYKNMLF